MSLSDRHCVPCQGGIPPLERSAAEKLLEEVPAWELNPEASRIQRRFAFRNFRQALDFVNQVGELAEQEGHHPDITFGWGYATVVFFTHKIRGLHENDFVMAARTDRLYDGMAASS